MDAEAEVVHLHLRDQVTEVKDADVVPSVLQGGQNWRRPHLLRIPMSTRMLVGRKEAVPSSVVEEHDTVDSDPLLLACPLVQTEVLINSNFLVVEKGEEDVCEVVVLDDCPGPEFGKGDVEVAVGDLGEAVLGE